jgi:hypothetical protein
MFDFNDNLVKSYIQNILGLDKIVNNFNTNIKVYMCLNYLDWLVLDMLHFIYWRLKFEY